jgi:hypothetical protein
MEKVVGAGSAAVAGQGRTHISHCSAVPNVEIAAVCDVDGSVLSARTS